jgi:hypothetical protein
VSAGKTSGVEVPECAVVRAASAIADRVWSRMGPVQKAEVVRAVGAIAPLSVLFRADAKAALEAAGFHELLAALRLVAYPDDVSETEGACIERLRATAAVAVAKAEGRL